MNQLVSMVASTFPYVGLIGFAVLGAHWGVIDPNFEYAIIGGALTHYGIVTAPPVLSSNISKAIDNVTTSVLKNGTTQSQPDAGETKTNN